MGFSSLAIFCSVMACDFIFMHSDDLVSISLLQETLSKAVWKHKSVSIHSPFSGVLVNFSGTTKDRNDMIFLYKRYSALLPIGI